MTTCCCDGSRGEQDHGSFTDLVQRHVGGVYVQACRQVRDAHLAEDVTQAVFLLLAKRAGRIREEVAVVGWLHRVTQLTCRNARRIEGRRRRHEKEAGRMRIGTLEGREGRAVSFELGAQLDEVISRLPARERDVLLLRYVQNESVPEIARLTRSTEAAARKRLYRALRKVRGRFAARGFCGPAALGGAAFVPAVVPAHLAPSIAAHVLAPGPAGPAVAHLAKMTASKIAAVKVKIAAALLIPVSAVTAAVLLKPSSELSEIAAHVLQPRRAIVSGQFIVHQHNRRFVRSGMDPSFWEEEDRTIVTWLADNGRFRQDVRQVGHVEAPESAAKHADAARPTGWIRCFADPDYFYFSYTSDYETSTDRTKWGGVVRNALASIDQKKPIYEVYEPRALMLSANVLFIRQPGEIWCPMTIYGLENVRVLDATWEGEEGGFKWILSATTGWFILSTWWCRSAIIRL